MFRPGRVYMHRDAMDIVLKVEKCFLIRSEELGLTWATRVILGCWLDCLGVN